MKRERDSRGWAHFFNSIDDIFKVREFIYQDDD